MNDRVMFQNRTLSALGGLLFFENLLAGTRLGDRAMDCLPRLRIASRASSFDKFRALLLGLVSGADCLEDMDALAEDPSICRVNGPLVSSTTYGDFLRKFSGFHLQRLNQELCRLAGDLHMRSGASGRLVLDIDSMGHEQHWVKMEGLVYNYKNEWGLNSIEVFDQKGFLHYLNVREGNAFTSEDAPFIISEVTRHLPRELRRERPLLRLTRAIATILCFRPASRTDLAF